MKLKIVNFLGIVMIALIMAGCGAKEKEMPATDNLENQSEAESKADKNLISEDEAKSIALKDAGLTEDQISGIRIKLERDDGIQQYEVEFYAGDKEYDYEIDAESGNILSKNMDVEDDFQKSGTSNAAITEEEAKKTALEKVSGAGENDIRIHQDQDDGKIIYEGTIVYKERKYEFEIDANSGKILEWEEESIK